MKLGVWLADIKNRLPKFKPTALTVAVRRIPSINRKNVWSFSVYVLPDLESPVGTCTS